MVFNYSDIRVLFFTAASLLFGWGLASLNTIQKHVILSLQLCGDDFTHTCEAASESISVAVTMVCVGAALGALSCGSLVSHGRRTGLLVTHLAYLVGGLISTFASSFLVFAVGRFLVGLAVGFTTVAVPLFVSEMTPSNVRGSRGVIHQLMITIGILLSIAAGFCVKPLPLDPTPDDVLTFRDVVTVKLLLAVPSMLSALCLVFLVMIFKDDSPAFYVSNDNAAQAARILQNIYQRRDVEKELREIVTATEEAKYSKHSQGGYMSLFSKKYIWPVIFGCVLSLGQQLTGINVFVTVSSKIFENAGLPSEWSTTASTGMAVVNVLMTFPALLVDRLGRKSMLACAVVGQTIFQSLYPIFCCIPALAYIKPYIAVVSVIGYIMCFAIGYGPILWLYFPEMYPVEIRAPAGSLASAVNWVGTIGTVAFGSRTKNDFVQFTIFASMSAFFAFWIIAFMKETKGLGYSPYFPIPKHDFYDQLPEDERRLIVKTQN